jgi:hypothetical protein
MSKRPLDNPSKPNPKKRAKIRNQHLYAKALRLEKGLLEEEAEAELYARKLCPLHL